MAFWRFRRRGAGFTTEQRLRALVGQAPSIFFVLDLEGRVLLAEGRLLHALSRCAECGVGSSVFDLFKGAP